MKERIKLIRKDAGLTQEAFGALVGSTRGMITTYESGTIPTLATRMLICEKFHVNQTWLETGEGEPYKTGGTYAVLRAPSDATHRGVLIFIVRLFSKKFKDTFQI